MRISEWYSKTFQMPTVGIDTYIHSRNPIRDGGGVGKKALHTSFSSVPYTNVVIRPQTFLNFSFNPFATLV